MMPKY
jgi:hypothetical protein